MFNQSELDRFTKVTKTGKKYFEFDTLYELGDLLNKLNNEAYVSSFWSMKRFPKDAAKVTHDANPHQGTNTLPEAINLLKYGWSYGAQKINTAVKMLSNSKTMKLSYSVVGGQVCVPRMLEGLPTNMIKVNMVEKPVKILNVYKSAGYPGYYSERSIIENSAKAIQIVELLESKGYRVNLFIVKLNTVDNSTFFTKVKVKGSGERLNIMKAAFCLANPAFQRRILWKLIEACPWITGDWYGYGRPVDGTSPNEMSPKYLEFMPETNKVFIPIEVTNVEEFVKNLKLQ